MVSSPSSAIAEHLEARRIGATRWIARCPAHADSAPSLTISEGRDGRVLLHCFAGCTLTSILRGAKLSMRQLFPSGPRPSPEALAAASRERERLHALQAALRMRNRRRTALLRSQWEELRSSADRMARALATMPEDTPGGDELAACFHLVMDEMRLVDQALTGEEPWL